MTGAASCGPFHAAAIATSVPADHLATPARQSTYPVTLFANSPLAGGRLRHMGELFATLPNDECGWQSGFLH